MTCQPLVRADEIPRAVPPPSGARSASTRASPAKWNRADHADVVTRLEREIARSSQCRAVRSRGRTGGASARRTAAKPAGALHALARRSNAPVPAPASGQVLVGAAAQVRQRVAEQHEAQAQRTVVQLDGAEPPAWCRRPGGSSSSRHRRGKGPSAVRVRASDQFRAMARIWCIIALHWRNGHAVAGSETARASGRSAMVSGGRFLVWLRHPNTTEPLPMRHAARNSTTFAPFLRPRGDRRRGTGCPRRRRWRRQQHDTRAAARWRRRRRHQHHAEGTAWPPRRHRANVTAKCATGNADRHDRHRRQPARCPSPMACCPACSKPAAAAHAAPCYQRQRHDGHGQHHARHRTGGGAAQRPGSIFFAGTTAGSASIASTVMTDAVAAACSRWCRRWLRRA